MQSYVLAAFCFIWGSVHPIFPSMCICLTLIQITFAQIDILGLVFIIIPNLNACEWEHTKDSKTLYARSEQIVNQVS